MSLSRLFEIFPRDGASFGPLSHILNRLGKQRQLEDATCRIQRSGPDNFRVEAFKKSFPMNREQGIRNKEKGKRTNFTPIPGQGNFQPGS